MLSQFNLQEALAWLAEKTGRNWADSELFQVCASRGVPLHAAPPLEAKCVVVEMNPDDPSDVRVVMRLGWRKAILHPWRVGQLWQVGETEPAPVWDEFSDSNKRWAVFDPPTRVKRDHLAIELASLERVVKLWRKSETRRKPLRAAVQSAPPDAGPQPLTTGDIAYCFDGLRWNEADWRKPLGDKRKWLIPCIAIPGQRGVRETKWNPVYIAAALVKKGHVSARSARSRFQTKAPLQAWLEAWKDYEAEYLETD